MPNHLAIGCSLAFLLGAITNAAADQCPGNPNALGTSRVITVNPRDYPLVGTEQYPETFRLENREVVITFDDGPLPPYTGRVLDALAAECVKATFFTLGRNVAESPDLVRRAFKEGHSIGTHTFNHEYLAQMPFEQAKKEIDLGIAATTEALGNARDVAPFFRAPYLDINRQIEKYLHSRGLMIWSIDVSVDDWVGLTEEQLIELTVTRLEKAGKGKGILLLHDIQPATARALPALLAELKKRNFKIVHIVPTRPAPLKSTSH
jgi:peptidoglycan/xylan/chitin deacetylase (PgdA/CDA1 family)